MLYLINIDFVLFIVVIAAALFFLFQQVIVQKEPTKAMWVVLITVVAVAFFRVIEAPDFFLASIFSVTALFFGALPLIFLGLLSFFFVKEKHDHQTGRRLLRAGLVCVMLTGLALLANRALWFTRLAASGGPDITASNLR